LIYVTVPNFVAISRPLLQYGDFSMTAAGVIWDFLKFLTVGWLKRVELRHRAKFG